MVYFPTDEDWTLTSKPDRILLEERFPPHYAVNSLPTANMNKKATTKGRKQIPSRAITNKGTHGKEQNTINQYFSRSQAKSKGNESAQEEGELHDEDNYETCFDNIENNDVECLIGSASLNY